MAILGAIGLLACGDDTTGGTTKLTTAQTQTVLSQANLAVVQAMQTLGRTSIRAATSTASATVSCTGGGTVGASGTGSGDANSFSYDITATFNDCGVTGTDGKSYTLGGSLGLTGSGTFDGNSTYAFGTAYKGTVSITGDGLNASCDWNLTSDFSFSGSSASGNFSGSVCGHDVSGNYSASI